MGCPWTTKFRLLIVNGYSVYQEMLGLVRLRLLGYGVNLIVHEFKGNSEAKGFWLQFDGQQLFMFRTKMSNFANNFQNGALSLICPQYKKVSPQYKKEDSIDSEIHSFNCEVMIMIMIIVCSGHL